MEAAVARGGREEAAEGPREHIVSTNGASAWIRVLHERLRAVLEANGRDAAVEALLAELAASGEDLQREYASAREETTKRLQDVRDHETLVNLQQGRLVEDWTRLRTENEEMAEANTALEARVKELETSERASVAQTKGLQTQMRLADGLMHDRAVRITALELKLSSAAATNPAATPEAKAAVDGQRVLIDDLGEDLLDDLMHADAGESDESDAILSLKEEAATLRKRLSEEEGRVTALQETAARHEVPPPPFPPYRAPPLQHRPPLPSSSRAFHASSCPAACTPVLLHATAIWSPAVAGAAPPRLSQQGRCA